MRAYSIVAATVLLALSTAHAQVYRWVDKNGKTNYSDTPPPSGIMDVELKKLDKNAIDMDKVPYATRDAAKKNPVTLYANNCGAPCDNARQLLSKRGIPFTGKNPESAPSDAQELKKLVGELAVPVLVVGKNPLKGFEADSWNSALDAAGYPKTAIGVPQPAPKSQSRAAP